MAWMAASIPASCPTHTCNGPVADCISSMVTFKIAFAIILRGTSPIPIGLTPGFLFRVMRRHATKTSIPSGLTFLVDNLRATEARALHRSVEADLKDVQKPSPSQRVNPGWTCSSLCI